MDRTGSGAKAALDGWVSTKTDDGALHIRVKRVEGRLVVVSVLVEADEITTDTLRQVQPTRVLASVDSFFGPGLQGATLITGDAMLMLAASGDDSETTLGELRSRAKSRLRPAKRKVIGRPDGSDPDGFYRRFAEAYRSAATESSKPAVILALENEVPVGTVHRWSKEARRRGHLAPGTRGRAG